MEHVRIHITGIVQGVGMRPFVYREATARGISGWVLNAGNGVHIKAHGEAGTIDAFVRALHDQPPAAASVESVTVTPLAGKTFASDDLTDFRIITSETSAARTTLVSPDIATCPDCLRELFDPANRRYHYPFINCTNCGPRFSIIRSLPYDRAATSMDAFPMCPACAREYADPLDRRFHAQPDACFACGPHLIWREPPQSGIHGPTETVATAGTGQTGIGQTREASDAIIARCADFLAAGRIVAVKGLGGFHLVCDAGNETTVRELRQRKRRPRKPLAIMVRSLETAEQLCHVDKAERELLSGSIRPIVLLRRRTAMGGADDGSGNAKRTGTAPIAPSAALNLPELGLMLPYTPLQHLLLAACAERGVRTLVMTSGNVSGSPIEIDDDAAWAHLVETGIADALLGNNRAILARYDDSVVRVVNSEIQMVRRARGYAPRPLALPQLRKPHGGALPAILACGAEQKATFALTRERADGTAECLLSQHIGDVEGGETLDAWQIARKQAQELFDVHPAALVCDQHPGYLTSQWARRQAQARQIPLIEVQHHHAHIASVIAEAAARRQHNPAEPVIGIAFDGTGAGTDGTIWGGEFLVADLVGFTRAAHLEPWPLPGGAASVRDPRRNAFSLLQHYGLLDHPGTGNLLSSLTDEERRVTASMLARKVNCPLTSSMGRLLDAIAAMLGICRRATYEGEPAIQLEAAAHRAGNRRTAAWAQHVSARVTPGSNPGSTSHPDSVEATFAYTTGQTAATDTAQPCREKSCASNPDGRNRNADTLPVDPSPLLIRLLDGIAAGEQADALALLAHHAIATMATETARSIARSTGIRTVALSGGVFMNRILLDRICGLLREAGFSVLAPHKLPCNDGCIAYGQAAIARARLATTR